MNKISKKIYNSEVTESKPEAERKLGAAVYKLRSFNHGKTCLGIDSHGKLKQCSTALKLTKAYRLYSVPKEDNAEL